MLQPEANRAFRMYTAFGKFHQTMKPHDCRLSQLKMTMYIPILCVMSSINHRIGENKDCFWTPGCFIIRVCACTISLHPRVCVSVWLTVDCLVAEGNSCYWGFLYEHVNKRKPPKSSPVCPPANENWAPSWGQPVGSEEGRDSAP